MEKVQTLTEAIEVVRRQAGSHDKLVKKLRENYGLDKASRTLVINWEKGAVPSGPYRTALVDLGVPEDLFPITRRVADRQVDELRADLASLRQQLADLDATVQRLTKPEDP